MLVFLFFLFPFGESIWRSESRPRSRRQIEKTALRWPKSTVVYFLTKQFGQFETKSPHRSSDGNEREKIKKSIELIKNNTCINFLEDKTGQKGIRISKDQPICQSSIGFNSKSKIQELYLGESYCLSDITVPVHELSHALGLVHMHSNQERDKFLEIHWENIPKLFQDSFKIPQQVKFAPYDYGSIMQYGGYLDKAINRSVPVMTTKDSKFQATIGSKRSFFNDFEAINRFYDCRANCTKAQQVQCKNGGKASPKNCKKCLCPNGFDGKYCEKKPIGCGEILQATEISQNFTYHIENSNLTEVGYTFITECVYWITTPKGFQVEITANRIFSSNSTSSCDKFGVEVKIRNDPALGGLTLCKRSQVKIPLLSGLNPTPLIFYSRLGEQNYEISYRAVPEGSSSFDF